MRVEIEIPEEFEEHFKQDKFKDSFERIMSDIKHSLENGDCLCAGRYEHETIEMLEKAFENSRQAYNIDKVVDELKNLKDGYDHSCLDNAYERGVEAGAKFIKKKAIEIVKQDECFFSDKDKCYERSIYNKLRESH